ncbi:MAG: hypothetical protein ACKVQS_14615 [Fimbriimonadaceae bacterium]
MILKRMINIKLSNPLLNISEKSVRALYALKSLDYMPPFWILYFVAFLFNSGTFPFAAFIISLLILLLLFALIAFGVYSYPIRTKPDTEFHGLAKIHYFNYGVKGMLNRITSVDKEISIHTKFLLSTKGPYSAIQYLTARTGISFDKARILLPLLAHYFQRQ